MEDFKDLYEKAGVLMQGALKKYAEGDFAGGDKERQQANELYDQAETEVNLAASKVSMLYGENRNFGLIYHVFESNAENLYKTKEGRKAIKEMVKLIKENKVLKKQHSIYNAFKNIDEDIEKGVGVSGYVSKLLEHIEPISVRDIVENNNKLISLFEKHNLNEMVQVDDSTFKLYEAIEYVITHNLWFNNAKDYIYSSKIIEEHLQNNIVKTSVNENNTMSTDELLDELKNRYKYSLNEDEQKVIDVLMENSNTEETFNKYKEKLTENIKNIINNTSDNTVKERLNEVINGINCMVYSKKTIVDDIVKLIKIEDKLSD